jgi:DNA-binding transcriptional MerR regulator
MNLVKITDLAFQLGISSRSLRFYEQAGLIKSVRPEFEKYRYYDEENTERLKQILVLRKMQIPIKDILRIYESEDMSVVVRTFVERIRAIDEEVGSLTELKRVTAEFLQAILENGISKISALPILYEKMEKQYEIIERSTVVNYNELLELSERLTKPVEPCIIQLPAMRVLTSRLKSEPKKSDLGGFWRWVQSHGVPPGEPGAHEQFEYQSEAGDVAILRIQDDYANDSPYLDYYFSGGLFASANVYLDEDLGERFRSLVSGFDANKYYEIDYASDGRLRHEAMLETLLSPDEKRELVSLLVPVKKRLADPSLFNEPEEAIDVDIEEIEAQNPVLWEVNVPLDSLTPINHPHYRVLENGEAEYISWISTRVLDTNIAVRLPFRVDIEFRVDKDTARYSYGGDEGAIVFHHGEDLNHIFGINMGNHPDEALKREAIQFYQPIFKDFHEIQHRGRINENEYNKLTWIVGEKHFAVIINKELRYCGVNFPYMKADLTRSETKPVILGSNGQAVKYFRSIKVSQLAYTPKTKIKEGEISMLTKRSNNIIPNIHRFITSEHGENYWFNGCARYVMNALGEKDYDYEFFAGLTGDVFAQVYPCGGPSEDYPFAHRGEGVTDYLTDCPDGGSFIESVFEKCGYSCTFVPLKSLQKNTEMYIQTLMAYIDKGVPVINFGIQGPPWGVFVGYEEYGKTLLFMTDNMIEPTRVPMDTALKCDGPVHPGWFFVGEKKEQKDLAQLYRDIITNLPNLLTVKNDEYCFGAEAFRAWADDIESGKFDGMKPEEFDGWTMHSAYICNAATNSSCCYTFLDRALKLNPDFTFITDIAAQYRKMEAMWNGNDGLETIGGGFNVTLEALQNVEKRGRIASKLREFAECADEVARILRENL